MLGLHSAGYQVLVPFGENVRYDLGVDVGHGLLRVQCKTGRLRSGAVRFATCSNYAHYPSARETRRSYAGEIDAFAVYCAETSGVYLVPIEEISAQREGALRVEPARNGQAIGVRLARQFLVAEIDLAAVEPSARRAV